MPSGSTPACQLTWTVVAPGAAVARTPSGAVSVANVAVTDAEAPARKYANAGDAVVAVAATAHAIAATTLPARRVRGIVPNLNGRERLVGAQVHGERPALARVLVAVVGHDEHTVDRR